MGMNSTNASDDDGTARMLAAPQRDGFHTPTQTAQTAANAFSTSTTPPPRSTAALANIQHTHQASDNEFHTRLMLLTAHAD